MAVFLRTRTILGSALGNIVEWYDFALYGFMAPILAALFFPPNLKWVALLSTYLIFGVSFIMRPVGAILYGYCGDRFGRRNTLAYSIILMGVPTLLIGLLPTYQAAGVFSPLLLLLVRLLQGLSAGGEFGGSATFLVEHAPLRRRGLFGSVAAAAMTAGILLGALAAFLLDHMATQANLFEWAWRIPFLCSAAVTIMGICFRVMMVETPLFNNLIRTQAVLSNPVTAVFKEKYRSLIKVALIICSTVVINYLTMIYLPAYLHEHRNIALATALTMSMSSLGLIVLTALIAGWLSDYFKPQKILIFLSLLTAVLSWFLPQWFQTGATWQIWCAQIIFALIEGVYWGMMMTYLVDLFPAVVRFTGVSFGYNAGFAIFTGITPLLAAYLVHYFSANLVFALILCVASLISLVGLLIKIR